MPLERHFGSLDWSLLSVSYLSFTSNSYQNKQNKLKPARCGLENNICSLFGQRGTLTGPLVEPRVTECICVQRVHELEAAERIHCISASNELAYI